MRLKHGNGPYSQGIAPWMVLALAVAAPSAWLAACSGDVDGPPQQAGAAGGTGGASSAAATSSGSSITGGGWLDVSLDQWWVYDGPAYDGDMSCAPKKTGIYQLVSCCDGQPCDGDCRLQDGAWTCMCFGIEGGCGPFGMKCCSLGLGCTTSSCFGGS